MSPLEGVADKQQSGATCLKGRGRLPPPLIIIEDLGFTLIGTQGTAAFYNSNGIKCDVVNKIGAGRPDIAYYEQGSLSGNQHSKS